MQRRITLLTLVIAGSGLAVLGISSPANAAVTASTITSPSSGTHWLITDANEISPPTVTVSGTTNGTTGDLVDIRCYNRYQRGQYSNGPQNVAVQADGSFSASMSTDAPYGTCVLRAVPDNFASTSNPGAFHGPKVTTEWRTTDRIATGPNAGKAYDYYVLFQGNLAMNDFVSATHGGLWDSRLQYADGSASNYLWYENAALDSDENGLRSFLQVDGKNAWGPHGAEGLFTGSPDLAGFPSLSYSTSRTATASTIHELDPIVVCSSNAYPPTSGTCTRFNSAGVTLDRTLTAIDGGRQVIVSDVWRSTDGKAHKVSPHYDQWVSGSNDAGTATVGLKLPWLSAAYQTYTSDHTFAGTANVPATIFVRGDNAQPNGSTESPRGALTVEHAPTAVFWNRNEEFVVRNENVMVPAGGFKIVRQAFAIGTTDAQVSSMAAAQRFRINQYRPDALIKHGRMAYVGNDVFNLTGAGQSVTARTKRGHSAVFKVEVTNDGTLTDTFKVKGAGAKPGFSVHYFAGKKDITSAVKHGTYKIRNLAPGRSKVIKVVIKVKGSAHVRALKSWLVAATSTHDTTSKDVVKALVRVRK